MGPEMAAAPQPLFQMLREATPVFEVEGVGFVLTRRSDVDEAFRHPELFSSNTDAVDLSNIRPLIPLQIDPPEHKKFRKLLDPIFAPKKMAALEDRFTSLVNELLDDVVATAEKSGTVDFAAGFSVPYPSRVFLAMMGLPPEELPSFLKMKDGIIRPDAITGKPLSSPEAKEYQSGIANWIYDYFDEILDEREKAPQDDILSLFLDAEVDGHRLTRHDILDICFLFLIAGLDTVTATLDCMFAFLAQNPEHRRELVDNPEVIPAAIEELLRWETPVMGVARVAMEDTEIGGCPVKKGDGVMALLGSANTDESDLSDAFDVRFDRDVNRHLAFGGGVHRCLGSHLARLELRVALREWHRRIPEYSVAPGHTLEFTPNIRSIDYFPMALG